MLLLDASNSISPSDFGYFKAFVDALINTLPISKSQMHLGVSEFAEELRAVSGLSADSAALIAACHNREEGLLQNVGRRTSLAPSIKDARDRLQKARAHSGRPQAMIVMTDGAPRDGTETASNFTLAKREDIKVLMVQVGGMAGLLHPPKSWLSADPVVASKGYATLAPRVKQIAELITGAIGSAASSSSSSSSPSSSSSLWERFLKGRSSGSSSSISSS